MSGISSPEALVTVSDVVAKMRDSDVVPRERRAFERRSTGGHPAVEGRALAELERKEGVEKNG